MDKPRLLIAVPHNSGTTYLANLIANYINPDIKYLHAADGYDGCDHVLSKYKLDQVKNSNLSLSPLSIRLLPRSDDKHICDKVSMTKNIFDYVVILKKEYVVINTKQKHQVIWFLLQLPIHREKWTRLKNIL